MSFAMRIGVRMSTLTQGGCPFGMRQMVDGFDWSATPLGERGTWPSELEYAVQQLLDSKFPKALAWGASLTTIYNDAFRPILGKKPEALGRPFSSVWAEAWDEIGPIADAAFNGQSTFIEDFPVVINRNGAPERAYFTFCYSPVRLRNGRVGGMLDTVVETTRTVEVQQELKLANEELAHRLKNSLAIVQAIAHQTLRANDPEAYDSFSRRLEALGHAHTVLLQQNWSAGSMVRAVADSLKPNVDMDRVSISGPDIAIGSKSSMALSMMLHELSTNAAKYGAMSNADGRVEVCWTVTGHELNFDWVETGGPPVSPPAKTGFGSRLIKRGLGSSSKGELSFPAEGVRFKISVPVADLAR